MRFTVPLNVHKYLGFLSKTTNMGGSEGEVAAYLLQSYTEEMRHGVRYPMAFSSDSM